MREKKRNQIISVIKVKSAQLFINQKDFLYLKDWGNNPKPGDCMLWPRDPFGPLSRICISLFIFLFLSWINFLFAQTQGFLCSFFSCVAAKTNCSSTMEFEKHHSDLWRCRSPQVPVTNSYAHFQSCSDRNGQMPVLFLVRTHKKFPPLPRQHPAGSSAGAVPNKRWPKLPPQFRFPCEFPLPTKIKS